MPQPPAYYAAVPTATAALTFLITWISPGTLGPDMVRELVALMMMEFVMMHATGIMMAGQLLMETRRAKLIMTGVLTVCYAVFAIGVPLVCDAPWLIAGFAFLVAGKFALAWKMEGKDKQMVHIASWSANFFAYILFVFFAWAIPFPRLGIDVDSVRFFGGDAMEDPHEIIAAGFFYFAMLTWANVVIDRKMVRPRAREVVVVHADTREPVDVAR